MRVPFVVVLLTALSLVAIPAHSIAQCTPSPEVCDGVDNDCNGVADDGPLLDAPPVGMDGCWTLPGNCCSFANLNWCPPAGATCSGTGMLSAPCHAGTLTCAGAAGWTCASSQPPSLEVCDGIDNDCNGLIDDGVPSTACVPPGTPPGLVYGGNSQCRQGTAACQSGATVCLDFVGPSTGEVCDGIDNDCDGMVDEGALGVGAPCGVNQAPCTSGTTACVNGALVCQGGILPQHEVCDGIDNDCNGAIDDGPLLDAPPPGHDGCWSLPGNCCTFSNLQWCPPAGATCSGTGALAPPCSSGTLVCVGAAGWSCTTSTTPSGEVCDGVDNNCNGMVDDGPMPQIGQPCGSDVGECRRGALACVGGTLDCAGDTPPVPDACNGLDDDCDGVIDNGTPCAPVAMAPVAATSAGFTASWAAAHGATSYRLDVASDAAFSTYVPGYQDLDVGNATSAAVIGLASGTAYRYRLRAWNEHGPSEVSNAIEALTVPAPPTALPTTSVTPSSFVAVWTTATGATSYRLDVATDEAFTTLLAGWDGRDVGDASSALVDTLAPGARYHVRVRAVNAAGESALSNAVEVVTALPPPVATAATDVGADRFTATWLPSAGAESYELDVATDAAFANFVPGFAARPAGVATSWPVTGLSAGTTYYLRVRAVSATVTSESSNVVAVQTSEPIGLLSSRTLLLLGVLFALAGAMLLRRP